MFVEEMLEIQTDGALLEHLRRVYKYTSDPVALLMEIRHERVYVLFYDHLYAVANDDFVHYREIKAMVGEVTSPRFATVQIDNGKLTVVKSKLLMCGAQYQRV